MSHIKRNEKGQKNKKNNNHTSRFAKEVKYMDGDERLVLAGASLGISMLIVWIVFIIALSWIRGIG